MLGRTLAEIVLDGDLGCGRIVLLYIDAGDEDGALNNCRFGVNADDEVVVEGDLLDFSELSAKHP